MSQSRKSGFDVDANCSIFVSTLAQRIGRLLQNDYIMEKPATAMAIIKIRMACDNRLPGNAFGYIDDLKDCASPEIIIDRLKQLERHVPDLFDRIVSCRVG